MIVLLPFIALSMVGMVLIVAGVMGLQTPDVVARFVPQLAPLLAQPMVAWVLIGVGVLIDVSAGIMQVVVLRRRAGSVQERA